MSNNEAWRSAPVPGATDELNVDVQFKAGRRCIVVRQRMGLSIVHHVVVIPLSVFKGIAATILTVESNAEAQAAQNDIAIARTPLPTEPPTQ